MSKEAALIDETISVSNVFEVVRRSIDKVGLEVLAPIEPTRLDEIISQSIVSNSRSLA